MLAASRLIAESRASTILVYDFSKRFTLALLSAPYRSTHKHNGRDDLPYFPRELLLDKEQIVSAMVKSTDQRSIDTLRSGRIRADQRRSSEIANELMIST